MPTSGTISTAGTMITIDATDGFKTEAYAVTPAAKATAGIICVMEAFGVNDHIRRVADSYAAEGYTVLAPALYDRLGRGQTFDYDAERQAAIGAMRENGFDNPLHDVAGCITYLQRLGLQHIGIVGYCYGGAVSWLAASRLDGVSAASCYYGSAIPMFPDAHPQCPTIAHWGREDPTTPEDTIAPVAAANPDVTMYWYDGAGHGFNSDDRDDFHPEASKLARQRTLAFFREHLKA